MLNADMITNDQIRAARALIRMSQSELADASGISEMSIKNIERGVTDPRVSTMHAIKSALEKAGIVFLDAGKDEKGGRGVRFKV